MSSLIPSLDEIELRLEEQGRPKPQSMPPPAPAPAPAPPPPPKANLQPHPAAPPPPRPSPPVGGGGGGGGANNGIGGAPPPPLQKAPSAYPTFGISGDPKLGKVMVSKRQEKSPLMPFFKNVQWEFAGDISPDFIVGASACVLFVQVKYHLLKPQYLERRMGTVQRVGAAASSSAGAAAAGGGGGGGSGGGGVFKMRVVIVHQDVDDTDQGLLEISRLCIKHEWTLLVASSLEEATRYIESLKVYENKPSHFIQERLGEGHRERAQEVLTTVRAVNKTDALTLMAAFPNVAAILTADKRALSGHPGIGEVKVGKLLEAFHTPFYGGKGEEED